MGILNWIVCIALIVLAVFYFISWFWWGISVGGLVTGAFFVISAVFTGFAPMGYIKITDSLFAFMKTPIWRPCFILVITFMSWYGGYDFSSWSWNNWICYIAAWLCEVIAFIMLVADILAKCGCCSSMGTSESM